MPHILLEAYEHRVNQVAQQIIELYHNKPVSKEQLRASIQARMHGIPLGSLKPDQFIKDVMAELRNKLNLSRTPSAQSQILQDLVVRMVHMVESEIGNQMPHVEMYDIQDTVLRKFRRNLENYFWDSPQSLKTAFHSWWEATIWPRVQREFRKQQGVDMNTYVADAYDQIQDDLAAEAAHKGVQVEPYLHAHGLSLDNPYR